MKKCVCCVMILSFLLVIPLVNAAGLSVTPAFITVGLTRGQQFNTTIIVYNPNEKEETFLLNTSGEITSWISFYSTNQTGQISQITIPSGSVGTFIANFKIPSDVPNKNYLSTIYVGNFLGGSTQDNTSAVLVRMPIKVSLNVTGEQNLSGNVINISLKNTEIYKTLTIKVEFENTGNIIATPKIVISIKSNNIEIANFTQEDTPVNSGNTSIIDADWSATGQTVGDYITNVKVFLGNNLLSEKNLNFKILESVAITSEGKIKEVTVPTEVKTGETTKVDVQFENIGEIDLKAKIDGNIYLDNNLITNLNSDETLIKIGETKILTAYFTPNKDGLYLIKSNVVYEGKKEPISDISINSVGGSSVFEMPALDAQSIVIIFVIVALVLISAGIVYDKSKKSKHKI